MHIARSTEARLVAIYLSLKGRSNDQFYCLDTLMANKCYIPRGKLLGFDFIAKRRSGSRNDYRSFSPTRGKGSEDLSVALKTQTQWLEALRSYFYILLHFSCSIQITNPSVFIKT